MIFCILILSYPIASASSPTGFEYYGSPENVTHVWNQGGLKQDWYFSQNSTLQLSNEPNNTWEVVFYGITWGEDNQELIDNYMETSSGQNWHRQDTTDNATYVKLVTSKNITIGAKTINVVKNNYIGVNHTFMQQNFYLTPYNDVNKNFSFVIRRTNISISNTEENDFLQVEYINNTLENFNISDNSSRKNWDNAEIYPEIRLYDSITNEYIIFKFEWGGYWKIYAYDGDVYLLANHGEFIKDEEIQLKTSWVDAICATTGSPTFDKVQDRIWMFNQGYTYWDLRSDDMLNNYYLYQILYAGDYTGDFMELVYREKLPPPAIDPSQSIPAAGSELWCLDGDCTVNEPVRDVTYYDWVVANESIVDEFEIRAKWTCGFLTKYGQWLTYNVTAKTCNYPRSPTDIPWNMTQHETCTNESFRIGTINQTNYNLTLINSNASINTTWKTHSYGNPLTLINSRIIGEILWTSL